MYTHGVLYVWWLELLDTVVSDTLFKKAENQLLHILYCYDFENWFLDKQ